MGIIYDAQGNPIGQTPEAADVMAPPQAQPAAPLPMPQLAPAGVGGAGGVDPSQPFAQPTAQQEQRPQMLGTGSQIGGSQQPAPSQADIVQARADLAQRQANEALSKAQPQTQRMAPPMPGAQTPRGPQFAPSSTQFQQAGAYYRPGGESEGIVKAAMGLGDKRAQLADAYAPKAIEQQERLSSVMDVETLKARKANAEQAQIEQMQQTDRQEAADAVRKAVDEHSKLAAPDPAQYWRGLGFAGSVGMILAEGLNTAGAGLRGQNATSLIEKQIDRSLAMQQAQVDKSKENIQQAQGLYGQLRQSGMDQQQAYMAAKARRLEDAAGLAESYSRQAKTEENRYALAQNSVDMHQKAAELRLQLGDSIMGQGKGKNVTMGGGMVGPGSPADLKQRMELAKLRQEEAKARLEEGKAADGGTLSSGQKMSLAKEIENQELSIKQMREAKAQLPTWWENVGGEWTMPANKIAAREGVKMAIGAQEPGTKTELDMQRYAKQAGHTGTMNYSPAVASKLHDEFIAKAEARLAALKAGASSGAVNSLQGRRDQEGVRNQLRGK